MGLNRDKENGSPTRLEVALFVVLVAVLMAIIIGSLWLGWEMGI